MNRRLVPFFALLLLAPSACRKEADPVRATFTASFDGSPRKLGALAEMLPRTAKVRFEMNLVPEGEGWTVAWASWSLVSEGTGP